MAVERDAHQVTEAEEPRKIGHVGEAERTAGEERGRSEQRIDSRERVVDPLRRTDLLAP